MAVCMDFSPLRLRCTAALRPPLHAAARAAVRGAAVCRAGHLDASSAARVLRNSDGVVLRRGLAAVVVAGLLPAGLLPAGLLPAVLLVSGLLPEQLPARQLL